MRQQADHGRQQIGLFLNPLGQRRVDFQAACGEQFARLFVVEGVEQATEILSKQQIDVLIIDLERFERSIDELALGRLIEQRGAAPVLLICPFASVSWLPALMATRPLAYALGPLNDSALRAAVAAQLAPPADAHNALSQLRAMRAAHAGLQRTLDDTHELSALAAHQCEALNAWPGVVHAALFHLKALGELRLEAQCGSSGIDLQALLGGDAQLQQAPLRFAFPGLLAAASGDIAYLDTPDRSGEPALAKALREQGVAMVIGLPIPASGRGAPTGALCLMFGQQRLFSRDELLALTDLAHLVGIGIGMAEMMREGEQLLARMTSLATLDALTGVANRQRGEALLEQELKRARRYKLPLALIAFDIDHFRKVNERYGHPVGDMVLRIVAEATAAALRSSDLLARSGGEEFQIIAPHTSAIDGLKIAEKIRVAIAETAIPGCDHVTISLGVAQLGEQESADNLMRRVDAALARAKRAGRNCIELAMA